MMHTTRRHGLALVSTAEELAKMLTTRTWTLCSAFAIAGKEEYLFLNDATHEDGAGEYAIIKRLPGGLARQIESITFSWCTVDKALQYIQKILAGNFDEAEYAFGLRISVDPPGQHDRCHLCA